MLKSKRIKTFLILLAGLMLLVASACGSKQANTQPDGSGGASASPPASSAPTIELTVSAAASLTGALEEIKTAFEAAHPSISLQFNFGASGTLQKQIEQGAPADLFLSASSKNMKALVDQGLVAGEDSRDLLGNSLVVIVPKDANPSISSLDALAGQAFSKIAIGIPESVPAGQYAQEALAKAGQWDALKDKLVQAKDVKAVLQAVETGNADAGFVYRTDALSSVKAAVAYEVDPASYPSIRYPAAIVKATPHRPEAEQFYSYLQSEEAMAVFKNYGFTDPK
ncbi:molybdenum ABC transporter substrate-binding protein [Paenibacillus sp. D9]|uniref:molybdate ABC transporter substrate-binding protein n=1 Tax=Paenibacillus TaxID=44249 RepID=UPI00061EAD6F|nr:MULTISPECIES: molybdate ABC transporter substrate-binding protein [Paenibacillus]KKC48651.1 molybdenum ABC transporter substrate-binding protein [Paenibacillus sp. D9]